MTRQASFVAAICLLVFNVSACGKDDSPRWEHGSALAVVESADDLEAIGERDRVTVQGCDASIINDVVSPRRLELLQLDRIDLDKPRYTPFGLGSLRAVTIESCQGLDAVEGAWLASFPALGYLAIRFSEADPSFYAALAKSQTIKDMEICSPESAPSGICESVAMLSCLEYLMLDGMSGGEDPTATSLTIGKEWTSALRSARQLLMLTFVRCTFTLEFDAGFVAVMPGLHHFEAIDCTGAVDDMFVALVGNTHVTWAEFSGTSTISDEFIELLAKSLSDQAHVGK